VALSVPVVVDEEVVGDLPQPGSEQLIGGMVGCSAGPEEDFLGQVGCLVVVSGE
jgi:hypothetical protein